MPAFPHDFPAFRVLHGVTVSHTLEILANASSAFCLQEIDCKLSISVANSEGSLVWSVDRAEFDAFPKCRVVVTAESDPALWELLRRSVMAKFDILDNEVAELAREAA